MQEVWTGDERSCFTGGGSDRSVMWSPRRKPSPSTRLARLWCRWERITRLRKSQVMTPTIADTTPG